jgi:hypothetical protein
MKPRLSAFSSPSFALISVLALVSLAALTATAFLASARLERQATRSLGETARLEMAYTSARECASQTLNIMCEPKWQTIATYWRGTNATDWTNEIGYLLFGRPNSAANIRWTYFCGFNPAPHKKLDTNVFLIEGINTKAGSYLTDVGSFMATMTNGFVTNPASTNTNCTLIPLLGGRTSPPVGWTYIYQDKKMANSTNTTNVPVARFSYFMEDLSGLIDAERMGGTNRTTGTNALEITLTNLTTNWSSSSIINASNYTQFINPTNRAKYFSPSLMLYAGNITTNDLRYFAHGLLSWTNFPNSIPVGIAITSSTGYGQGDNNTLKVNLNSAANQNVTTIADAIRNNLPSFTNRAGGMAGTAYLNNIAANIVDYIDTDSYPTIDSGSPPSWRGCEAIAWPNEIFTRIHFETTDTKAIPGGFQYSFKYKHYLEIWNINNTNVPVPNNFVISNNRSFLVRIPPLTFNLNSAAFGAISNITMTPVSGSPPTLRPGEFGMLETPTITLRTNIPGSILITNVQFQDWNQNSSVIYMTNAPTGLKEISRTKMGSLTYNKDILASAPYGVVNGVNFASGLSYAVQSTYRAAPPNLKSIGGDPRAQMFLGTWPTKGQLYVNYSSPGGLNWESGNSGFANGYVNATSLWPDGGRFKSSDLGANPTSYGTSPETYYGSKLNTWSTNLSLAKINNSGKLTNICELGNIFDPMQWEDSSQLPTAAGGMPGLWTNLSTAAKATNTAGGRISLRIGRPEFNRFAFTNLGGTYPVPNMGLSSAALLDIFSLSDSCDTGGRINLNTAPAPVLRALAGGITLSNDPAMTPSATLAIPKTMTEAFAQGVMRYRSIYPFLSPSQLAFIATDYGITNGANHWTNTWPKNAVFGNTNTTIPLTNAPGNTLGTNASLGGVTAWNDQAAEEWFSKIYHLTTTQSWNYRVYVVSQLVNTNGLPTGPSMKKYSLMYIRYSGTFPTISAGPFTSFESPY